MKVVVSEEATILVEKLDDEICPEYLCKKHGNKMPLRLIGFNGVDYKTVHIQILMNDKPTRFRSISPR